jgi:hypothetical protein
MEYSIFSIKTKLEIATASWPETAGNEPHGGDLISKCTYETLQHVVSTSCLLPQATQDKAITLQS